MIDMRPAMASLLCSFVAVLLESESLAIGLHESLSNYLDLAAGIYMAYSHTYMHIMHAHKTIINENCTASYRHSYIHVHTCTDRVCADKLVPILITGTL